MKKTFNKSAGILPFLLLGIFCSVLSFLFRFYWDCFQIPAVGFFVYAVDICFLFANVYILVDRFLVDQFSETKRKKLLNTMLGGLWYLSMFLFVGCYLFHDRMDSELFLKIVQIAIFLAPVLIILLPVYYLIAYIFAG